MMTSEGTDSSIDDSDDNDGGDGVLGSKRSFSSSASSQSSPGSGPSLGIAALDKKRSRPSMSGDGVSSEGGGGSDDIDNTVTGK